MKLLFKSHVSQIFILRKTPRNHTNVSIKQCHKLNSEVTVTQISAPPSISMSLFWSRWQGRPLSRAFDPPAYINTCLVVLLLLLWKASRRKGRVWICQIKYVETKSVCNKLICAKPVLQCGGWGWESCSPHEASCLHRAGQHDFSNALYFHVVVWST